MLFDSESGIKKYDTPEDILREFYDLRLGYSRRKAALLKMGAGGRAGGGRGMSGNTHGPAALHSYEPQLLLGCGQHWSRGPAALQFLPS